MSPVLRVIRAIAFSVVCVIVSAGAHLFAGGGAIALPALLLGLAVPFALALAVNGRERSRESLLAATMAVQLVLHQMFAQVAPPAATEADHCHPTAGMTLVHLMLGLLSGWWLHRGESAVWTALSLWAVAPPRLLLLIAWVPAEVGARLWQAVPCEGTGLWHSPVFTKVVHRRGPPVLACAV
ncbi:hypothetical protein [Nonomuraea longicatena]|uniref:MFS transporter n=1 Tax=Nonomuraea longicatena TaxID=83682 RepID=A0ABN1NXC5_9ACTN